MLQWILSRFYFSQKEFELTLRKKKLIEEGILMDSKHNFIEAQVESFDLLQDQIELIYLE